MILINHVNSLLLYIHTASAAALETLREVSVVLLYPQVPSTSPR